MTIYNTNDKFGDCGPFESENFETLADEMMKTFSDWADQNDPDSEQEKNDMIQKMRAEFITGLEILND